jgi:hypothetical protein
MALIIFFAGVIAGFYLGDQQWHTKNANGEIDGLIHAYLKQNDSNIQDIGKIADSKNNKTTWIQMSQHRCENKKFKKYLISVISLIIAGIAGRFVYNNFFGKKHIMFTLALVFLSFISTFGILCSTLFRKDNAIVQTQLPSIK